jgi:hypothetical protein
MDIIITRFVLDKTIFIRIIINVDTPIHFRSNNIWINAVSENERQILATEKFYADAISAAEQEDVGSCSLLCRADDYMKRFMFPSITVLMRVNTSVRTRPLLIPSQMQAFLHE